MPPEPIRKPPITGSAVTILPDTMACMRLPHAAFTGAGLMEEAVAEGTEAAKKRVVPLHRL